MADPAAGGCFLGLPVAKKSPNIGLVNLFMGGQTWGLFFIKMPQNNNTKKSLENMVPATHLFDVSEG